MFRHRMERRVYFPTLGLQVVDAACSGLAPALKLQYDKECSPSLRELKSLQPIHAPMAGRVRGEIRVPPVFGKGNRPTPNTGRRFCFCRLGWAVFPARPQPWRRKFMLKDSYGRDIHDLRISVTDRCNFRCVYCKSADPEELFPSPQPARLGRVSAVDAHHGRARNPEGARDRRRAAAAPGHH